MQLTHQTHRAVVALTACAVSAAWPAADAATFTVLHQFTGADGAVPFGSVTMDAAGNLYGATYLGGAANFGTLFRFDGVQLSTLYAFSGGSDGGYPEGGLLADGEGNLYGTSKVGGTNGYGTVFRWDREAQPHLRTLKTFVDRAADGVQPAGGLARDADGTLYGTTFFGGTLNCGTPGLGCGTVFKISAGGVFTQLHRFGGTDGYGPAATLSRAGDKLWGATVYWGPSPAGSPYSLKTDGTGFAAVPTSGGSYNTIGGLVRDPGGNLWGAAFSGGTYQMGGIYKIDAAGVYTLVHAFNGSDGAYPTGTLAADAAGNLWGTTEGAAVWGSEGAGPAGYGTVFRFDPKTGTVTTLHQFTGADGKNPVAGLVRDPQGNLYGVTAYGGSADKGVLFRVSP